MIDRLRDDQKGVGLEGRLRVLFIGYYSRNISGKGLVGEQIGDDYIVAWDDGSR